MSAARWLGWALAGALVLALAVACGGKGQATGAVGAEPGSSGAAPSGPTGTGATGTRPATPPGAPASGAVSFTGSGAGVVGSFQVGSSRDSGISVSGTGLVVAQPDRAVVTVGVEARSRTVAAARADAARAMTAIVAALKARGVAERDIQTQFFNIAPQYTYRERIEPGGGRSSEQVLVGYIVSNQASITVRDLERLGELVDQVAEAGGDLTRIQGVGFTIQDPTRLHAQAREAAVKDALAKAQQFASLTGVTMGRLVSITEAAVTPIVRAEEARARGIAVAAAPTTPISGGELSVQVTVQAVFAIQ